MSFILVRIILHDERDVVLARQRARQVSDLLGLGGQDVTRVATAVSEMARVAARASERAEMGFGVERAANGSLLLVEIEGADIELGDAALSANGPLGVTGALRLMDCCWSEEVSGGGRRIKLGKRLPKRSEAWTTEQLRDLAAQLAGQPAGTFGQELRLQNRELLETLDELERVNAELRETNQGVVALYAELSRRQDELEALNERLRAADRAKTAFLAAVSHDLRTPLNSILGFTGLLLRGLAGPLNEEQRKQLGMIEGSGRHLLDLINDVLDISKIEAGEIEVALAPFHMDQLVLEVTERLLPQAEEKGLALGVTVGQEVGALCSDRRRVQQVLNNLLSNAIKFTDSGHINVTCSLGDRFVVTRVSDTGVGIRPEDMGKLFSAFPRIEPPPGREYEGTGLGLSICRRLVERLGGSIEAESAWGQGSSFRFSLPLEEDDRDA